MIIQLEDDKMRGRFLIALVLMILNLMICSFSFAQTNAANTIIENRIDELWSTGKLNIGYANIASKHWLPGPHNALGRIKFIFSNKYFIYLHDTPSRSLYGRKDRAFSSGCIRVEKNFELAELLIDDPEKWNRDSIQKLLETNETRRVNLLQPKPVVLIYATVRFDDDNKYIFKKDVYERDPLVIDGLNEEFTIW